MDSSSVPRRSLMPGKVDTNYKQIIKSKKRRCSSNERRTTEQLNERKRKGEGVAMNSAGGMFLP
jgi:hypothetical protein